MKMFEIASKRLLISILLFVLSNSCSTAYKPPQVTILPTSTISNQSTSKDISPPKPTQDNEVLPYLDNVEVVLRHSAVVISDRALGIPDACPALYLMAFPYSEPDRRGGMTIQVTSLEKNSDGSVIIGEHKKLWNLKAEGVDPERCKQIFIQNISEPGLIRISFQVQHPDDKSWRIGVSSGTCSEQDLWLAGYFHLNNPDDFQLIITQYDSDSAVDYWLRDGTQLLRYQWEPWQESLLWILDNIPGTINLIEWNENSPDFTGDGLPDLIIEWIISGAVSRSIYSPDGSGFTSYVEN